ncbi:hypothetical protein [Pedobacter punctiformis]|uniref:Peptidase M23 domain-containing protein n=1 Tax=Pedobacter punctiformis TaxID=3004097 RepID=A0ABT4LA56_9SPHI|nr:hypothetical protein [Pedobacter sp. HCMS5-2]MCZ4244577.1 hypothetical protein [Pedobacter sp. HCMS5-2]
MVKKTKLILVFLLLSLIALNIKAQESIVKLSYVVNSDKSVDLDYLKEDPGTYSLMLRFSRLDNSYYSDRQVFNIGNYSGKLIKLSPSNKEQGIGFSYSYSFIRGKLNPKYNADFVYIMPYKKGTPVVVAEMGYVGSRYFGKTAPEDWKVYSFSTEKEDSVTAVRKGVVVEIKDLYENNESSKFEYTSKVNELTVEHADGTLAIYKSFKKGSFTVKVGQTIYPGTVLGVNSRYRENSKYNVSLYITYLKSIDFESAKNPQNPKSLYGFVVPHFYTADDPMAILVSQKEYTVENTPEIIRKEFSKKELKASIK